MNQHAELQNSEAKISEWTLAVLKYRLLEPIDWDIVCQHHLFLQAALWNTFVALESAYRDSIRKILATDQTVQLISDHAARLVRAQSILRKRRSAIRQLSRKKVPTESIDDQLRQLGRQIQAVTAFERTALSCAQAHQDKRAAIKILTAHHLNAIKNARKQSGLWWGNSNAVWKSFCIARLQSKKSGTKLRVRRFVGEGRFTVQISGGASVDDVCDGKCTPLRIDLREQPVPWRHNKPFRKRRLSERGLIIEARPAREPRPRPRLTFTVHSHGRGRQRRTVTFPLVYDRPLPQKARIQQATITRRRVGTRFQYHVVLLLRVPALTPAQLAPRALPMCGINLGFRLHQNGTLRILTLVDDSGSKEHTLSRQWMSAMDELDAIQHRRDRSRDEIAAILRAAWPERPSNAPLELESDFERLLEVPQFAARRLAGIIINWRIHYPHYWSEMCQQLEKWRRVDKYWLEIFANKRQHLLANRLQLYRDLAHQLAGHYGTIKLGHIDLQGIVTRERFDGTQTRSHPLARRNRVRASLHTLKQEICHQANKAGVQVITITGQFTQQCHVCERLSSVGTEMIHRCSHCGTSWDQDINACLNILRAEYGNN